MPNERYRFPAKRYGWGWGLPSAWQVWIVLIAYSVAIAVGLEFLRGHRDNYSRLHRVAYVLILSVLLCVICWWEGEKPRWRGEK